MKNKKPSILLADDERNTRDVLVRFMRHKFDVTEAEDGIRALKLLENNDFDLVLTDLKMPGADGMAVLKAALKKNPSPQCIMLTAYGSVENAVEAMKAGAFDFVTKPVNFDRLEILLERALESSRLKSENAVLKSKLEKNYGGGKIIAKSPRMKKVLETVEQVAPTRATVLITGESGTGKEVIAEAIHRLSGRKGKLLPVHCAALPPNLLESELFGHEKGAFTGAVEQKKGRFELADNGTLFLDEIGEIDPQIQVKLLRVLESRSFERVGGIQTLHTDTRVITATNRDLAEMVRNGDFREDLYYRLEVVTITLPPLRQRQDDIPIFIKHFMDEFSQENSKDIKGVNDDALSVLCSYSWPGNVRELKNCIERMVVLSRTDTLTVDDVPPNIREKQPLILKSKSFAPETLDLDSNEKALIKKALEDSGGNRTKAAEKLGISRRTLHRKINAFKLD